VGKPYAASWSNSNDWNVALNFPFLGAIEALAVMDGWMDVPY